MKSGHIMCYKIGLSYLLLTRFFGRSFTIKRKINVTERKERMSVFSD